MKKILLILLLFLTMGCSKSNADTNPDNTKSSDNNKQIINITEPGVVDDKNYDEIVVSNISFYYDGVDTSIKYTITNNTLDTIKLNYFDIIVKDESGNTIGSLLGRNDREILSKDSIEIITSLGKNFTKAKSIEFDFRELEIIK